MRYASEEGSSGLGTRLHNKLNRTSNSTRNELFIQPKTLYLGDIIFFQHVRFLPAPVLEAQISATLGIPPIHHNPLYSKDMFKSGIGRELDDFINELEICEMVLTESRSVMWGAHQSPNPYCE